MYSEMKSSSVKLTKNIWETRLPSIVHGVRGLLHNRKWPLLRVLDGSVNRQCESDIAACERSSVYEAMPYQFKTRRGSNFVFRMLSRSRAYLHEWIMLPHSLPPFSLLRCGIDDSYFGAFERQCPLLRDTFSEGFVEYHALPSGGSANYPSRRILPSRRSSFKLFGVQTLHTKQQRKTTLVGRPRVIIHDRWTQIYGCCIGACALYLLRPHE